MKNRIAARHRLFQGRRVAQITHYSVRSQVLDVFRIAVRTDQQSQVRALLG
jgi:hypothetical protein